MSPIASHCSGKSESWVQRGDGRDSFENPHSRHFLNGARGREDLHGDYGFALVISPQSRREIPTPLPSQAERMRRRRHLTDRGDRKMSAARGIA